MPLFFSSGETWYWVGGHDFGGQWIWDGYSRSSISLSARWWNPNEPNNCCGGEDCFCINNSGRWNDCKCHGTRPFVCEKRS